METVVLIGFLVVGLLTSLSLIVFSEHFGLSVLKTKNMNFELKQRKDFFRKVKGNDFKMEFVADADSLATQDQLDDLQQVWLDLVQSVAQVDRQVFKRRLVSTDPLRDGDERPVATGRHVSRLADAGLERVDEPSQRHDQAVESSDQPLEPVDGSAVSTLFARESDASIVLGCVNSGSSEKSIGVREPLLTAPIGAEIAVRRSRGLGRHQVLL